MSSRRRRRSSLMKAVSFRDRLCVFEQKVLAASSEAKSELGEIDSHVSEKIDMFERLAQLLDPKYRLRAKLGQPQRTKEEEIRSTIESLRDEAQQEQDELREQLKEQKKFWESRIEDAEHELSRLRFEIASANEVKADYEEKLRMSRADQSASDALMKAKGSEVESLLQLVREKDSQLAKLAADIRSTEISRDEMKEKYINIQQELDKVREEFESHRSKFHLLTEQLLQAQQLQANAEQLFAAKNMQLMEMERSALEQSARIESLRAEITTLCQSHRLEIESASKEKSEGIRALHSEFSATIEALHAEKVSVTAELAEKEAQLALQTKSADVEKAEKDSFKAEVDSLRAEISSKDFELRSSAERAAATIESLRDEIASTIRSSAESLLLKEAEIASLAESNRAAVSLAEDRQQEIETLRSVLYQKDLTIRSAAESQSRTDAMIATLYQSLSGKAFEIETLQRVSLEKDSELSSLRVSLASASTHANHSQNLISEQRKEIELLNSQLSRSSVELLSREKQMEQLEISTKVLQEEKLARDLQLFYAQRDIFSARQDLQNLTEELYSISTASLDEKNAILAELQSARKQIVSATKIFQSEMESVQDQHDQILDEMAIDTANLRSQLAQLQRSHNELQTQQSTLELELLKEKEKVSLLELSSSLLRVAQGEIVELKDTVEHLTDSEKEADSLRSELNAERSVTAQLSQDLSVSESRNLQLAESVKSIEKSNVDLRAKYSELADINKLASDQIEKEHSRSSSLQQRLAESLQNANQLENQLQFALSSNQLVQKNFEEKCDQFEKVCAQFDKLVIRKCWLKAKLRSAEYSIAELVDENDRLTKVIVRNFWQRVESKQTIAEKDLEIEGLESRLAQTVVRSFWRKVDNRSISSNLVTAKARVRKLKAERAETKRRLSSVNYENIMLLTDKNATANSLRSEVKKLTEEKSLLRNQIDSIQLELKSVNEELSMIRKEKEDIEKELEITKEKTVSLSAQRNSLNSENGDLKKQLSETNRKALLHKQSAAEELSQRKNQLRHVEAELLRTTRKADSALSKNSDLQKQVDSIRSELSAKILHHDTETRKFAAAKSEFQKDKRDLEKEISSLGSQLQNTQNRIPILEKEISSLGTQLRDLRVDLQVVQSERDNLRSVSDHYRSHLTSADEIVKSESKTLQALLTELEGAQIERKSLEKSFELKSKAFEEKLSSLERERQLDVRRLNLRSNVLRIQKEELEVLVKEKEVLLGASDARLHSLEAILTTESNALKNAKILNESLESSLSSAQTEAAKVAPLEETLHLFKSENDTCQQKIVELSAAILSRDESLAEVSAEKMKLASHLEELKYELVVLQRQVIQQRVATEKASSSSPVKAPLSPVVDNEVNKSAQKRKLSSSARRAIDFKNLHSDEDTEKGIDSPQIAFKPIVGILRRNSSMKELKMAATDVNSDCDSNPLRMSSRRSKENNEAEFMSPPPKPPVPRFGNQNSAAGPIPPSPSTTPRQLHRSHRRGMSINLSPQVTDADLAQEKDKRKQKPTSAFASKTGRFDYSAIPDPARYDRSWKQITTED